MYNYGSYLTSLMNHLEDSFDRTPYTVKVVSKFPDSFIPYPLIAPTLLVSCHQMDFETVGSQPSGTLTLEIKVYTQRDGGLLPHTEILDKTLEFINSLEDFSFSSLTVKEAKFDRSSSAIYTQILGCVNF